MSDSLLLRDARPEDAAVIAEIYNETILARDGTMIDVPLSDEDILKDMRGFSAHEGYLVLECDGLMVGWGVIKKYGEGPAYRFTCETSVFLRRSEVRKGYGSRIKQALIDRGKEYGYRHLVARIWASNTASIEYNRRFGYEVVGIQKEIGHIGDRWLDIAVMQLVIRD